MECMVRIAEILEVTLQSINLILNGVCLFMQDYRNNIIRRVVIIFSEVSSLVYKAA